MIQSNSPVRLDILHYQGIMHVFYFKIKNKLTETFLDFTLNALELYLFNDRGANVGSSYIYLNDNYTAVMDLLAILPNNYSGTIKYAINYYDQISGIGYKLLTGNINIVDEVHQPAENSTYVPINGNTIIFESNAGIINNYVFENPNSIPGPQGPKGDKGDDGGGANIQVINLDNTWDNMNDRLQLDDFTGDIILVTNNTGTAFTLKLNPPELFNYYQPDAYDIDKFQALTFYKVGNTIISAY